MCGGPRESKPWVVWQPACARLGVFSAEAERLIPVTRGETGTQTLPQSPTSAQDSDPAAGGADCHVTGNAAGSRPPRPLFQASRLRLQLEREVVFTSPVLLDDKRALGPVVCAGAADDG
jgi:hypothetical protein